MRKLMLEKAGGKWNASQKASCILLADTELLHPDQLIHHRREGWKCKDGASCQSPVSSVESRDNRRRTAARGAILVRLNSNLFDWRLAT
jgi:hypothetical protein